jgi:acyl-CoA synthetase (AMP-forming)/AMP-acid ligase II
MVLGVARSGADLSSWRRGVQAEFTGQGLASVRAAEDVGALVSGGYGSSETFAIMFFEPANLPTEERTRSGGFPLDPASEARFVDGEMQLRGPCVTNAYLVEEGTESPPLTDDGWFCTGDLGVVEDDGSFTYLARLGDALRLSGFLTDPAEIEQHLRTHPAVTGAQVVGAPLDGKGDVAVAFVTVSSPVEEATLRPSPAPTASRSARPTSATKPSSCCQAPDADSPS